MMSQTLNLCLIVKKAAEFYTKCLLWRVELILYTDFKNQFFSEVMSSIYWLKLCTIRYKHLLSFVFVKNFQKTAHDNDKRGTPTYIMIL